jgi:hypothetical protein
MEAKVPAVKKPVKVLNGHANHANGHTTQANGHTNGQVKLTKVSAVAKKLKALQPAVVVEPVMEEPQLAEEPATEAEVAAPPTTPVEQKTKTARPRRAASATNKRKKTATTAKRASGKAASRSKTPATAVAAKPAKVAVKAAKGTKVVTKVAGRVATQPPAAQPKSKRPHNTKRPPILVSGIGLGPARVKHALYNHSLNVLECKVRSAILKAENKPVKPKKTVENDNPVLPPQGPQVPISKLSSEVQELVKKAELHYERSLREAYERDYLSQLEAKDANLYLQYTTTRKASKSNPNFNSEEFNQTFDKNFYAGFPAYKLEHDNYQVGKPSSNVNGTSGVKYNEWTRAVALINKLCIRVSGHTRTIIACFLDRIVEQYARNGIYNCTLDGKKIVKIEHAIQEGEQFMDIVPLSPFVKTFLHYSQVLKWLEACQDAREQHRAQKQQGVDPLPALVEPEYPTPYSGHYFEGYVNDICRGVRITMSEETQDAAKKALYLEMSVGADFKRFCSFVVFEAILRIGDCLHILVETSGVKTISDAMVRQALSMIHASCGIDFASTNTVMNNCLAKHKEFNTLRKDKRKEDRANKSKLKQEVEAEDEEQEAETEEQEAEEMEADADELEIEYETA